MEIGARIDHLQREIEGRKSTISQKHQEITALQYDPRRIEKAIRHRFGYLKENEIVLEVMSD